MKRLLLILACLMMLMGTAAAEESYVLSFAGEWPEMLRDAVSATPYADSVPMQGYASCRWGRWEYGQAVARDREGYILMGFLHTQDGWVAQGSRKALRQDAVPQLWVQAVAEEWSEHDVSQSSACMQFELVYDDARYGWFCGSNGWNLIRMMLPVANVTVGKRELLWNEEAVFNTLPTAMTEIDLAAYPTTMGEAMALADKAGLTDASQALTTGNWGMYAPDIPMYAAPNRSAQVIARYFDGVPGEVVDMGSGFVRLRIGGETGWISREYVLLGGERAAQYPYNGQRAQVYAWGKERYQQLYAEPSLQTVTATLEVNMYVDVMAVMSGGESLQVMLRDGVIGYMDSDAVCQTDNLRESWVRSDDPADRLHLRAKPSTKAESYGKYYAGVPVTYLFCEETHKGWSRVIIAGRAGWMKNEFLNDSSDATSCIDYLPPMGTVQGVDEKGLNLRLRPDYDAEILARYPLGTKVEIMAIVGSWAHVRLRDGSAGYMLLKHLGGEPKSAVKNEFLLTSDQPLMVNDAAVGELAAGAKVRLYGSRPWLAWRYEDEAMQLMEPASTWVGAGDQYGFVPTEAIDFGW